MAAQPLELLVWNVRGLNAPARRNAVFQVVNAAKPAIGCFQKTKVENMSMELVRQCLGNRVEKFFYLSAVGTRGGVMLAWDPLVVTLSKPHRRENTITAHVKPFGPPEWWLTGVYIWTPTRCGEDCVPPRVGGRV